MSFSTWANVVASPSPRSLHSDVLRITEIDPAKIAQLDERLRKIYYNVRMRILGSSLHPHPHVVVDLAEPFVELRNLGRVDLGDPAADVHAQPRSQPSLVRH
jgi:hypothetical protein